MWMKTSSSTRAPLSLYIFRHSAAETDANEPTRGASVRLAGQIHFEGARKGAPLTKADDAFAAMGAARICTALRPL
jgi:hypothetical protein